MKKIPFAPGWLCIVSVSLLICCAQEAIKDKPAISSQSSAGSYDFEHPEVYKMPAVLNEISGIAFNKGNTDLLYAQQDEEAVLYSLKLGSSDISKTKFYKKGDFEDVQILDGQVLMLRSDGVIFSFSFVEPRDAKTGQVRISRELVPPGEYESLYADQSTSKVYVLCKKCNEKPRSASSGFIFTFNKKTGFVPAGNFTVNGKEIAEKSGSKKTGFEPSALGKNPVTMEWFVLSSVNKLLVIADDKWRIKSVIKLDGSLYNQAEGLAFDKTGNLYISNERGSREAARILKIKRR